MPRRPRRRRSRALGSTDRTHERLARDYLRRAERDFQQAQETESCVASYGALVRANTNWARAHEHAMSTAAGRDGIPDEMINVGQKIHEAVTKFGTGPCMRRTAYDKG